ncbi:MAG: hypothetical protein ACM3NR_04135 [Methanosarcina sp.]
MLNRYFEEKSGDLKGYKETWNVFENLFTGIKENNAQISRALLFYGDTWIQVSPYYYENYDCHDWYSLVRSNAGKYLIELLEDLHGKAISHLDVIIKTKAKEYFIKNDLNSLARIISIEDPYEQFRILSVIDYYSDRLIWRNYSYVAFDDRFTYKGDIPFFITDHRIFNIQRYVDNGWQGRIIDLMKNTLQDAGKLEKIMDEILK